MSFFREWRFPRRLVAVFAVLAAVTLAYVPGLHGPFVFDDEIHILNDLSIRISDLHFESLRGVVAPEGGLSLSRPLSKVTLAMNYYWSGGKGSAFGYKLTNLAIHLVNTALVYWLSLLLIRIRASRLGGSTSSGRWVPFLVAALWALHPLHLTTVLYVVQRMTILAALCVFAGMIAFIYGRQRIHEGRKHGYLLVALGAIGGLTIGMGFKENAAVLLPLLLVMEYVFFGVRSEAPAVQWKLVLFYGLTVLLPALFVVLWLTFHPGLVLDAYVTREFTLVERLLTQPRILWFYVSLLFFPDIGRFSLFHDDIPISTGWFQPWTTLVAILAIAAAVAIAILARRRYPFLSFAILWYLVGHSVESTFIGLEIAHEHRNYLPDFGIVLAAAYGLFTLANRFKRPVRLALLLAPVVTLGFVTAVRASTWATDEGIIESLVRYHPNSARGQYMLAELYAERRGDPLTALVLYLRATELAPHETGYRVKAAVLAAEMDETPGRNPHAARQASGEVDPLVLQLREQPLTPTTIHILEQLADCGNPTSKHCRTLYPQVRDWYLAVLQNPVVSDRDRARFAVHLFNWGTSRPDLDLALQAAQLGKRFAPNDLSYSLMEANVFLLRGDLDLAERLLMQIRVERADEMTNEIKGNLDTLSAAIASKRIDRESSRH